MDFFVNIFLIMGRVLIETFTSPLFIFIFLLLFYIIGWQYKRLESISEKLVNSRKNMYLRSTLVSSVLGVLGGILGSILLVVAGVDLSSIGILQLWIVALLLMIINPRFLCFAYAGGIISISSLLLGYPRISIPQLMGLIAILHMVESFLILLNGRFNSVPVYVKKQNNIRGGFNLQKFWPIPLIALIGTGIAGPGTGIDMPDWWPLLKDYSSFVDGQSYSLIPVMAVLGYGEITTTSTPYARVKKSALNLFIFSLVLLFLSILSSRWDIFLGVAALFSPIGHEFVIWLGMRDESNKKPIYMNSARGTMVLDVKAKTAGERAGIKSQDIILSINGLPVNPSYMAEELVNCSKGKLNLEIMRGENIFKRAFYLKENEELGIIPVPEQSAANYIYINEDHIFDMIRRIWRKMKAIKY